MRSLTYEKLEQGLEQDLLATKLAQGEEDGLPFC